MKIREAITVTNVKGKVKIGGTENLTRSEGGSAANEKEVKKMDIIKDMEAIQNVLGSVQPFNGEQEGMIENVNKLGEVICLSAKLMSDLMERMAGK